MTAVTTDYERARIEYAHKLEQEIGIMRQKLEELSKNAEWMPKFGVKTDASTSYVTMELNGKRQSIAIDLKMVGNFSNVDLTTAIFDSFKPLLEDIYKPVIADAIAPIQAATASALSKPIMGS